MANKENGTKADCKWCNTTLEAQKANLLTHGKTKKHNAAKALHEAEVQAAQKDQ